jgi:hypothetical protein
MRAQAYSEISYAAFPLEPAMMLHFEKASLLSRRFDR